MAAGQGLEHIQAEGAAADTVAVAAAAAAAAIVEGAAISC